MVTGAAVMIFGCKEAAPPQPQPIGFSITGLTANQPIPARMTCSGANRSPAVAWSDVPAGTRSFAVIVDDPDAPMGDFGHWGTFDIDARARGLPEGAGNAASATFQQARNDFGASGYSGPCPPVGTGAHHYRFRLFALDVAKLDVGSSVDVSGLERATTGHVVGEATIVAPFVRN